MEITKPWHAQITVLVEQVAKGAKPLATTTIKAPSEHIDAFIDDLYDALQPDKGDIEPTVLTYEHEDTGFTDVTIAANEIALRIYHDAMSMSSEDPVRHFVLGCLHGFGIEQVLRFCDAYHNR